MTLEFCSRSKTSHTCLISALELFNNMTISSKQTEANWNRIIKWIVTIAYWIVRIHYCNSSSIWLNGSSRRRNTKHHCLYMLLTNFNLPVAIVGIHWKKESLSLSTTMPFLLRVVGMNSAVWLHQASQSPAKSEPVNILGMKKNNCKHTPRSGWLVSFHLERSCKFLFLDHCHFARLGMARSELTAYLMVIV